MSSRVSQKSEFYHFHYIQLLSLELWKFACKMGVHGFSWQRWTEIFERKIALLYYYFY